MQRLIQLTTVILVVLTTSAPIRPPAASISLGSNQVLSAAPGQTIITQLQLSNDGYESSTVQMSATAPPGWLVAINPMQVTLDSRARVALTITITIPSVASSGLVAIQARCESGGVLGWITIEVVAS